MTIDCSWSLEISEKLYIVFVEDITLGWLSSFLFPFLLFLLSHILSHQSALHYFSSGEVDSRTAIRVPPGCFIFYQYHLLLLQYHDELFLHLLNG